MTPTRLMRITRTTPTIQRQQAMLTKTATGEGGAIAGRSMRAPNQFDKSLAPKYDHHNYGEFPTLSATLCRDCDSLNYCQLARNLSHSHGGPTFTSHNSNDVIIGELSLQNPRQSQHGQANPNDATNSSPLPDRHILAEKLKLRYKTCPFHRELSLGLDER